MTTTINSLGIRASVKVGGLTITAVTPGVAGNSLNIGF